VQGGCQYAIIGQGRPDPSMLRCTPAREAGARTERFSMQIRVLASISIFVAGAAHSDPAQDVSAEIARCAAIGDSSERLKCFDAAAPRTKSAPDAHQSEEARDRADGFGIPVPHVVTKEEDFGKPPPPPEITEITATVLELARSARGRSIFILDNGQVWRQLDGDDADVQDPQPGKTMKVAIEAGFFGNYNLTIEGRNALIRVRRVK